VDEEIIIKIINSMEAKKSSSFDEVTNALIKTLKKELAPSLSYLVNLSLIQGIFPDKLKLAKIVPLFKSGKKGEATNYRPISLLSVFSKIYEKVVYRQLTEYFSEHFLTKYQFGFREKHETNNCIMNYLNNIYTNKGSKYNCSLFIDLKKAFDTVSHEILINKLTHYGLDTTCVAWFSSYLSNRKQATAVNNVFSELEIILCGVPQGSILGPLLFLIFINDLPDATSFLVSLFADDTTLQHHGNDLKTLEIEVNKEIKTVTTWFRDNMLSVHPQKTNCMVHKTYNSKNDPKVAKVKLFMDNIPITQCGKHFETKSIKFLGVLVDDDLNWKEHIAYVANKVRRVIFSLNKIKYTLPIKINILLLQSLIMPHFEYCLNIYGNSPHIMALHKLQKWAICNASKSKYNAHTTPLFKKYKILKLGDLYTQKCLIIIRKIIENVGPVLLKEMFTYHALKNRQHHVLVTTKPVNKLLNLFPNHKYPLIWNKQGLVDLKTTINSFKNTIKTWTLETYDPICAIKKCHTCSRR
jgi:hypothetical protein